MLESLAIFVFVLTPQLVFFPVVRSLQKGALKRRVTLSLVCGAAGTAAVFYVLIGVFGYLASAAVQRVPLANIVLQFDLKLVVYQTAAVAMLINLVLNFGLFFLSAREVRKKERKKEKKKTLLKKHFPVFGFFVVWKIQVVCSDF